MNFLKCYIHTQKIARFARELNCIHKFATKSTFLKAHTAEHKQIWGYGYGPGSITNLLLKVLCFSAFYLLYWR